MCCQCVVLCRQEMAVVGRAQVGWWLIRKDSVKAAWAPISRTSGSTPTLCCLAREGLGLYINIVLQWCYVWWQLLRYTGHKSLTRLMCATYDARRKASGLQLHLKPCKGLVEWLYWFLANDQFPGAGAQGLSGFMALTGVYSLLTRKRHQSIRKSLAARPSTFVITRRKNPIRSLSSSIEYYYFYNYHY